MAYPLRFRTLHTAFGSVLRHNADNSNGIINLPSGVLTCIRTFQTTRPIANDTIPDFASILSKSPIPKIKPGKEESLLQSFDSVFYSGDNLEAEDDEYHLHIYSTKHNTHITFTDSKKNPIISVSAGNLGFKKAQRGTYDAAYQLASHVFAKLEEKKIQPRRMEVVLRDFGEGREAALKALLGTEGRNLKGAIKRVTDATRLKFGGTRSKKPRRLVGLLLSWGFLGAGYEEFTKLTFGGVGLKGIEDNRGWVRSLFDFFDFAITSTSSEWIPNLQ